MKNSFLPSFAVMAALAFSLSISAQIPSPLQVRNISKNNLLIKTSEDIIWPCSIYLFEHQGDKHGRQFGISAASAAGFEQVMADKRISKPFDTIIMPALIYYDLAKKKIKQKEIKDHFYALGFLNRYEYGYGVGKCRAMQEFSTGLHVTPSQTIEYPFWRRPLLLDYDNLANLLSSGSNTLLSPAQFEAAIYHSNLGTIEYLNRNLAAHLTREEQTDALGFYVSQYHQKSSAWLYACYAAEYQKCRRLQGSPYFDNSYYLNVHLFNRLFIGQVGTMSDAAFSFAKGTPEFASNLSFPVLGKICELTEARLLPRLPGYLLSNSLINHYDFLQQSIQQTVRDMFDSLVIESRFQRQRAVQTFNIGNITFRAKAQVNTAVNLGLETSCIVVKVDHARQEIQVHISRKPRLLQVLHQDHQLLSGVNRYKAGCSLKDIKNGVTIQANGTLTNDDLNKILIRKTRIPVARMRLCRRHFGVKTKKVIVPELKNIMEPVLANLPHSNYQVVMFFGKQRTVLFD